MKKHSPDDVDGDAVASARAVTEYWYEIGRQLGALDKYRATGHVDAPTLTGLTIKCDPEDVQGVLVIAKGFSEAGWVVAFHRDETIVTALVGMARRLTNHTAKWKKDEYANGK